MIISSLATALLASLLALGDGTPEAAAPRPQSAQQLLAASSPSDWRRVSPEDTLYLELDNGRVIIELAPQFAPAHVDNIRKLAREGYWDGLPVYRSHDNYVVEFGDPDGVGGTTRSIGSAKVSLPIEFSRPSAGLEFDLLPDPDGWAPQAGLVSGFPAARESEEGQAWLAHCYGTVGAGRDNPPDSGNGSALYVVIGHAPRHLDRNVTVVGRVLQGMELLSALPRGDGPLGIYRDRAQHVPIRSMLLASTLPEQQRVALEVLKTDSAVFRAVTETRRNRTGEWFHRPAGYIDLCNVSVPVREASPG